MDSYLFHTWGLSEPSLRVFRQPPTSWQMPEVWVGAWVFSPRDGPAVRHWWNSDSWSLSHLSLRHLYLQPTQPLLLLLGAVLAAGHRLSQLMNRAPLLTLCSYLCFIREPGCMPNKKLKRFGFLLLLEKWSAMSLAVSMDSRDFDKRTPPSPDIGLFSPNLQFVERWLKCSTEHEKNLKWVSFG